MSYGIKIYKKQNNSESHSIIFTIWVKGYLYGVKKSIKRYRDFYELIDKDPIYGVYCCFYELSTLLEHLSSIENYLKKAKLLNIDEYYWVNYRNYLRHDIRENLEKYTDNRKTSRLKFFHKNNSELEFKLEFEKNHVIFGDKFGDKNVYFRSLDVEQYCSKIESKIKDIDVNAKELGFLKKE
jgi:hypothetical protein